jgi:ankyrin repeat protein
MIRQRARDTDYIDPIIIHAAMRGHMLLLEFIHSIVVNIHRASSMRFPSPLRAAIHGRQLQVVRWLIKHGADCNTRYSDGHTPLYYAVTEGSLDVVRVLVEEGGASVDVRNDCGRTAIDWANDCASDRNGCDTVKYLEER